MSSRQRRGGGRCRRATRQDGESLTLLGARLFVATVQSVYIVCSVWNALHR
jgi:hypothetical protein